MAVIFGGTVGVGILRLPGAIAGGTKELLGGRLLHLRTAGLRHRGRLFLHEIAKSPRAPVAIPEWRDVRLGGSGSTNPRA